MDSDKVREIQALLDRENQDVRRAIFRYLRAEFGIHPLEERLNIPAETILEAIDRSSDLTLRGVRGVIAEAVFKDRVVTPLLLEGWIEEPIIGDQSFDFLLSDAIGDVRIQVKMQRQKARRPMTATEASKRQFPNAEDMWVVETQRTRGGKKRTHSGESSTTEGPRPYRYGDFDILAVSLHPSTKDWSQFLYTLGAWLIADHLDSALMFKYQPVSRLPNRDWTCSLQECIEWFRSKQEKTIGRVAVR
jgi:hypothetical protein